MKRLVFLVGLLVTVSAAWFAWHVMSEPTTPTWRTGTNVVLITIDTLRADRVGKGLTPNIDRLSARGATYRNVRASAPLTLPSHLSIMTGLTPPAHGVRENGVVFDRKSRTLARVFRDAGYRTSAFVSAYVLNRRFGIDEGFETYDDAVRRDGARAEQLEAERPGVDVIDAALKWLPGASSPFFVWVHLYDPHAPYEPPAEFLRQAGSNAYDGEVAYADAQVGRLLEALETRGLSSSTIVAVTGDHGESLGEHGEQTHGMLAYDATLRVPMVVANPADRSARVDDAVFSLAGLGGVLLRAAGMQAEGFGEGGHVYAESWYPRRAGWHPVAVLVDDQWKLILSSERELFDVRKDPGEQRNVAGEHPSVAEGMAQALMKLQAARRTPAQAAPEAAERLRALGYVSGSRAIASDDPKGPNPARVIDAWTSFERALGQLQDGRPEAAIPTLNTLRRQHPGAPVFLTTYAQALTDAGRAREAVPLYKTAVAKWPGDAALFHDLAVAARAAGESGEASRAEHAALALDGNSALALNGLGLLHADGGRHADAASAFEKATAADPTNASYWANLGNARRALSDARAAESAYRKALEIDPSFADALNGLGTLLVQSGRAVDAVPLFERALQSDPHLHEARLNLGIAYQQSGQRQRAAEAYRRLLATAPASTVRERKAARELLRQLK